MRPIIELVRQKRAFGLPQIVGLFMIGGAFVLWIRPGSLTLTWIYQTYDLWLTTDMMAIALAANGWALAWFVKPAALLFAVLTSPILVVGVTVSVYAIYAPGVTGIFGYFTIGLWLLLQFAQALREAVEKWIKQLIP